MRILIVVLFCSRAVSGVFCPAEPVEVNARSNALWRVAGPTAVMRGCDTRASVHVGEW